jgi:hypothetical protein
MPLPIISATTPIVVPAVQEKVFDRYWMKDLRMIGADPNQPVVAIVTLQKACLLSDNWTMELLDGKENEVIIKIDDLLGQAQTDPDLAAVVVGVLSYTANLAANQL